MTEDLYPVEANPVIPEVVTTPPVTAASEVVGSGFLGLNLDLLVSYINVLVLAWCIFYSVFYICDFYFYLIKYPDREVERMQKGAKSFQLAVYLWSGYLVCLVFFGLYLLSRGTALAGVAGVVTIIAYLYKLLGVDLPRTYYIGEPIANIYKQIGKSFSDIFNGLLASNSSGDKKK